MRRFSAKVAATFLALVLGVTGGLPAMAQDDDSEALPTIRMARATWDTGWFQAAVYAQLFNQLGYRVDGPVTMENQEFYDSVAAGEPLGERLVPAPRGSGRR